MSLSEGTKKVTSPSALPLSSSQSYLASVGLADILAGKTATSTSTAATTVNGRGEGGGGGFGSSLYLRSQTVSALQAAAKSGASSSSSLSMNNTTFIKGDGTNSDNNNDNSDDALYRIGRDVLLSLAKSTPLDSGLDRMVRQRPIIAELLADQTVWITATVEKIRRAARVPKHARPIAVDDEDGMPCVSAPTLQQPSVVLIGCGFVGSRVADRLLESKVIYPTSLYIMTRQPETLAKFSKAGALCGSLKPSDVSNADVLVIATLPGQLSAVGRSLRGYIKASCVVISLCAGVTVEKVCAELQHPLCIVTEVDIEGAADIALFLEERGDEGNSASRGVTATSSGVNLRRHCEEQLFHCLLPPHHQHHQSKESEHAADPSLVPRKGDTTPRGESPEKLQRAVDWLSRLAFVLSSAGTAMGMPFHCAAFAVWSFMVTERCRIDHFIATYKDYVCPPPSDEQRMEFCHLTRFVDLVGITITFSNTGNFGERNSLEEEQDTSTHHSRVDAFGGEGTLTPPTSAGTQKQRTPTSAGDDHATSNGKERSSHPHKIKRPAQELTASEAEALIVEAVREKMASMLRVKKGYGK